MKLFLFCFFSLLYKCQSEAIFTSPIRTVSLFFTIERVTEYVDMYIKKEEENLNQLEKIIKEWREEHNTYIEDEEHTLSNPIKNYNYLRKLKTWWPYMINRCRVNSAQDIIHTMKNEGNFLWPGKEDMNGIMDSWISMQQIYGFDANSFTNGKFGNKVTNSSLLFIDCFMMAERCIETYHYEQAMDWTAEALTKYYSENVDDEKKLMQLFYYLSLSSYIAGYPQVAMESIDIYLKNKPDRESGQELKNAIETKLKENRGEMRLGIQDKINELCRKSFTDSTPFLKCQYNNKNSHFLRIAPLKEEILSIEPKIILYRDIIYDSEINSLKHEFDNKMTIRKHSRDHYLQRTVSFESDEFEALKEIDLKIKDMTGMLMNVGEEFEMSKYEIGGYSNENEKIFQDRETYRKYWRRMAKTIIHLNDIEEGGSTVFPDLDLAVKAVKGTALVWFNSAENGKSTDHLSYSSCPVLVGRKWMLTKWTNQRIAKRIWRNID